MTSHQIGSRLTFGVWTALAVATMALALLNRPLTGDLGSLDSVDFVFVVASVGFAAAAALVGSVVAHRIHHPIGWLLLVLAVTILLPLLGEQYAFYGIVTAPGSLPVAREASALAFASWALIVPALVLILALFPTGKPRSSRWRVVTVATPVAAVFYAIASAVQPASEAPDAGWHEAGVVVENPFAIDAAWARALPGIGGVLVIALFLAAVASLVLRFRGSRGVERQQIKWLAYVAMAAALCLVGIIFAGTLAAGTALENAVGSIGWALLVTTVLLGMPLAIGASILRYRLYDIDRVISRTLSYALLTGVLGGVYAGLVFGLGAVLPRSSDLTVAASTLVVAALFGTVRRRVQSVVDRRFNRSRYDAVRTVDAFASRLRDEIDLGALEAEIADVVTRTVQPASVSVWLRRRA